MSFECTIHSLSMGMLHHKYNMEIFRLDAAQVNVSYSNHSDHMKFATSLKDISLYDLTGYPYTIDPK